MLYLTILLALFLDPEIQRFQENKQQQASHFSYRVLKKCNDDLVMQKKKKSGK